MSLTKASYAMISSAPISVLDFGADPTGATDSTAAIQAAIDYAHSLGKPTAYDAQPTVYIPEGRYILNDSLELKDYAVLHGAGPRQTFLIADLPNQSVIRTQYGETPTSLQRTVAWDLRDFTIKSTSLQTNSIGLNMGSTGYSYISNVYISGMSYCVWTTHNGYYNTWNELDLNGTVGMFLQSDGGANTIINPHINFTDKGIQVDQGDYVLIGGSVEGLGVIGSLHYCLYVGRTPTDGTNASLKVTSTYFETYESLGHLGWYGETMFQCTLIGPSKRGYASLLTVAVPANFIVIDFLGDYTPFTRTLSVQFSASVQGPPTASLEAPAGNQIDVRNSTDTDYGYLGANAIAMLGDYNRRWTSGSGSPEGSATASPGALYTNTGGGAGTTLYVKETGNGNTGWVAK